MRSLLPLILCASALAQSPAPAPPILEPRAEGSKPSPQCATHHDFASLALQRKMGYCLLLPAEYEKSRTAYPVLYLLHGLWGSENDWLAHTEVAAMVRGLPLIVVMPNADDGWYTNSAAIPAARYEDYVFRDVIHEIDSHYRTTKAREGRFIAGLSMGGYGAVKAALRHPEMFAAAGGFSGVYHAATRNKFRFMTPAVAFGPEGGPAHKANDDFALLEASDPLKLPYLFVMTGAADELVLQDNRDFLGAMNRKKIRYEYHEVPGNHEWPVWERCLKAFLETITPQLPAKMG